MAQHSPSANRHAPARSWIGYAIPIALSALIFAIPLAIALESALHFSGVAIDGPFQLYNALRRIQAGFRPGIDFQFFHGIGIPYLHYPLYRLFGGRLGGSELARQLLSTLTYPIVFVVAFRTFTGDWRRTWWLTAAALAISIPLHLTALTNPLNGMLGLRSTLPTLMPVVFYVSRPRAMRVVAMGVCLGLSIVLSTEQGIAAVLAFCVVSAFSLVRPKARGARFGDAAMTVGIAVVSCVLLVFVVAGRGTFGVLNYNLRAVPMDQYWYFGAPPNVFISAWGQLPGMLIHVWPVGLGVLLGVIAAAIALTRVAKGGNADQERRADALGLLAAYGVISCASLLGIFAAAYIQPAWRVVIILGLLGLTTLGDAFVVRRNEPTKLGVPSWMPAVAVAALAWMCIGASSVLTILGVSVPHIVRDHVVHGVGFGVSGMWPATMRADEAVVASRTDPAGKLPSVWSTYAGWLEARYGIFNPSFDYIIHALGPANRGRYLERFRATQPALVQTVLPSYTQYEPWIEQTSWDFYEDLLRRYSIVQTTPWSLFWERQAADGPPEQLIGEPSVDPTTQVATLAPVPASPGMPVTLLTVEVEYQTRNPLGRLPLIGSNPRYLVGIEGALPHVAATLDPYVTTARFPLVAASSSTPSLSFRTFSLLPGATLVVRRIRVWQVPVAGTNQEWLADLVKQQSAK